MSGSPASGRAEAAATFCWPESRRTQGFAPEYTFGWEWIGTLRTPQARSSCLFAGISVSESRNSFGCTFKEGGTMNRKKLALLVLLGSMVVVPAAQAQIKHIEMRVEGMT